MAAEVCREIDGAISEHDCDMRKLKEKYNRIHGQTTVFAIAGFGALVPALFPLTGSVMPIGVAAKFGNDKLAETQEKRHLARSYSGVLASLKK